MISFNDNQRRSSYQPSLLYYSAGAQTGVGLKTSLQYSTVFHTTTIYLGLSRQTHTLPVYFEIISALSVVLLSVHHSRRVGPTAISTTLLFGYVFVGWALNHTSLAIIYSSTAINRTRAPHDTTRMVVRLLHRTVV